MLLLSLVWDPMSHSSQVLERLDISRGAVIESLGSCGVPLPLAALPKAWKVEVGEKVWFERPDAWHIASTTSRRVPVGTWVGFNFEGKRAYVQAEASVDLESLVAEVISETDDTTSRPSNWSCPDAVFMTTGIAIPPTLLS